MRYRYPSALGRHAAKKRCTGKEGRGGEKRPSAIEVDRQETQLAVLGTTREGLYTLEEYLSLGRTKPTQTAPAHSIL